VKLTVLNAKIRKPNGDLQPIAYENAVYRYEADQLVIEHDCPGGRAETRIPREHVAAVIKPLENPQ
jgi:hypothetical protein